MKKRVLNNKYPTSFDYIWIPTIHYDKVIQQNADTQRVELAGIYGKKGRSPEWFTILDPETHENWVLNGI